MHEYSIAQAIVEQVDEIARKHDAHKVTKVVIEVGKLRGVLPDILSWGFEVAATDTLAAGARLEVEEIPIRIQCRSCGAESQLDEPAFICRSCHSFDVAQLSGGELILKSLEIENDANPGIAERSEGQ